MKSVIERPLFDLMTLCPQDSMLLWASITEIFGIKPQNHNPSKPLPLSRVVELFFNDSVHAVPLMIRERGHEISIHVANHRVTFQMIWNQGNHVSTDLEIRDTDDRLAVSVFREPMIGIRVFSNMEPKDALHILRIPDTTIPLIKDALHIDRNTGIPVHGDKILCDLINVQGEVL